MSVRRMLALDPKEAMMMRQNVITVEPEEYFRSSAFFRGWKMGEHFRREFGNHTERTNGRPVNFALWRLRSVCPGNVILEWLGGIERAAITLPEFAAITERGRSFSAFVLKEGRIWQLYSQQGFDQFIGADPLGGCFDGGGADDIFAVRCS